MPDSLRQMVNRYDREHAPMSRVEPARPVLAHRQAASARRICLDCRREPNRDTVRAQWLRDNPLPKRYCRATTEWCVKMAGNRVNHRAWHEQVHIHAGMPPLETLTRCPFCDGELIEVVW
jgi:hypothetical protein